MHVCVWYTHVLYKDPRKTSDVLLYTHLLYKDPRLGYKQRSAVSYILSHTLVITAELSHMDKLA